MGFEMLNCIVVFGVATAKLPAIGQYRRTYSRAMSALRLVRRATIPANSQSLPVR
jgi:hypothetical protein